MSESGRGSHILVVDDEPQLRGLMRRILVRDGYECSLAAGASQALEMLSERPFELAICDIGLGPDSGLDLAAEIRLISPDTAILMATAKNEPDLALLAADIGVFGYMVKPFTGEELRIDVANALCRRQLEIENRHHRERLSALVEAKTSELRNTVDELKRSRLSTIHLLSKAVATRDTDTGIHIERIGDLAAEIGRRIGLPEDHVEMLHAASPMHDVGKIGIADHILRKPGALTEAERREMERHTTIGYDILSGGDGQPLDMAAEIALTHHEKMDGSGYPRGLQGDEVPLEGRIAAVVDVFDALISDRVYRKAFSVREATEIMLDGRGTHFDPEPLDALLSDADTALATRRAASAG